MDVCQLPRLRMMVRGAFRLAVAEQGREIVAVAHLGKATDGVFEVSSSRASLTIPARQSAAVATLAYWRGEKKALDQFVALLDDVAAMRIYERRYG